MPAPNFTTTSEDFETIRKIAIRAKALCDDQRIPATQMDLQMYVSTCHANGCPLRLQALLEADDFNFAHDVFGICRHMDQSTGKLTDCFVPRFAKPAVERVA